jgi:uncharacterized ferredoxin-like protein
MEMMEYVEWYKGIKEPSFNLKELYFDAIAKLDQDVRERMNRLHNMANAYQKEIWGMQTEAIQRLQMQIKADFLNKMMKFGMTKELKDELRVITKMEKSSCYGIRGLKAYKRECSMCGHQSCKNAEAREESE